MSDASASYLPLSVPVLRGNEMAYVSDCIETGWVSSAGPYVTRFEEMMCDLTGAKHAVACQSGTAALHVALVLHGIGAGDAVICPTLTFIATANAIAYTGARPVMLGCDEFMNLDPEVLARYLAEECEQRDGALVDRQTGLAVRAIMPVHVFGNPCDMAAITAIAEKYGLVVIEDSTESLGSRWTDGPLAGRHTGTIGDMGTFSFNGNKIVTSGGGGCIVTDDGALADRARHLTTTAKSDPVRFVHDEVGYNYRLTNLAAALGCAQLEQLEGFSAVKQANYERYADGISRLQGVSLLGVPAGTSPNCWFYSLLVETDGGEQRREALMAHFEDARIQTRPVWRLLHRQAPYAHDRSYGVERAEWFADRVLNLPCSSDLTGDDVARVLTALGDFLDRER